MKMSILGKGFQDGFIQRQDIFGVPGQGRPSRRSLALAKQRPDVSKQETGVEKVSPVISYSQPANLCLLPQIVAVVKADGAPPLHFQDCFDMLDN